MTLLGVLFAATATAALVFIVLYWLKRREIDAVATLTEQIQRIADAGAWGSGRAFVASTAPELTGLSNEVNRLFARLAQVNTKAVSNPRLFFDLADRIHQVVLIHREHILFANQKFASLVGLDRGALLGRTLDELVAPEFSELVAENLTKRRGEQPAAERFEIEIVGFQGQVSRLEILSSAVDYEGKPALLITGVEIIQTAMMPALAEAPFASDAQRAVLLGDETTGAMGTAVIATPASSLALQSIAEAIVTTDRAAKIEYMNPAAEALFGIASAKAYGKTLVEIAGPVDESDRRTLSDPIFQTLATGGRVSIARQPILVAQADGSERSIELSASPMRNAAGEVVGAAVLLHDVTEMRGIARKMSYQAAHDALTGLVNRREFERRLDESITTARSGEARHMLCYLDLDHFKIVNDSSGHTAGDGLLREVAKILRDAVRDSDTVARLGGDEFGLLLVGCPPEKARQIADDVARAVAEHKYVWRDRIYQIGVSVGLVELGPQSGTVDELLAAADSACYVAKKQGSGGVAIYSAREQSAARGSGDVNWLQRLQNALRDNAFELSHQSIVPASATAGEGPALEVLVRLRDEQGRELQPSEFLGAAERYRLMGQIDRWVVKATLDAMARELIQVAPRRSVSINISGQTLADTQFLEYVVECLDQSGVSPGQVCFEMTENAVVANMDHARRFVGVLHGMGCKFALDNFGSGVGSFSNLKNLPMDYLKIDGAFTRNLPRDTVNQAMVTAMIKLARTLNFKVIAEQVEDEAALDYLRRMGVDFVQGYAISRPRPLLLAA